MSHLGATSWSSYGVVRRVDWGSPQDLFCPSLFASEKEHDELVVEDPDLTVRFPSVSLCTTKTIISLSNPQVLESCLTTCPPCIFLHEAGGPGFGVRQFMTLMGTVMEVSGLPQITEDRRN